MKRRFHLAILMLLALVASAYAQGFRQGYPADKASVQKLYDQMDIQRATQAYMWSFPAVSFQSMYEGSKAAGVQWNDMLVADKFANSKSLFLKANTTSRLFQLRRFFEFSQSCSKQDVC